MKVVVVVCMQNIKNSISFLISATVNMGMALKIKNRKIKQIIVPMGFCPVQSSSHGVVNISLWDHMSELAKAY